MEEVPNLEVLQSGTNLVGLLGDGGQKQALRAVTRRRGRGGGDRRSEDGERRGGDRRSGNGEREGRGFGEDGEEGRGGLGGEYCTGRVGRTLEPSSTARRSERTGSTSPEFPATLWEEHGLSRCVGQDLTVIKGEGGR
ncbi:hypothetical protein NDU88_002883 [Pleurodeles waltl]|uniref:Uncharacterized protein n=1 Tax=Pleurodeles waltl TaxID=8319 RepID=A0AAV7W3P0_PLEWA|nr:hypothetical protein NDU88_002883 [Pleurodeles waltl]